MSPRRERLKRILWTVTAVYLLGLLGTAVLPITHAATTVTFIAITLAWATITIVAVLQWRKARRRLVEHNFHVCCNCAYPLTGLDEAGSCPECGHTYGFESTRRYWKDVM